MSTHLMTFLPLRVTSLRTVNPSASLMTISNRRTEPALLYIFSQFCHTMFDPRPGDALEGEIGNIGNDFSFELGADLFSKKAHDFLGAKAQRAMTE